MVFLRVLICAFVVLFVICADHVAFAQDNGEEMTDPTFPETGISLDDVPAPNENASLDTDGDGFLDEEEAVAGSNPLNAASMPETCDGLDNNGNGLVDEGFTDIDGDGTADCSDTDKDNDGFFDDEEAIMGSDPMNLASTPEACDGLDNDLDRLVDEGFPDANQDGYADCAFIDSDKDNYSNEEEIATDSDPFNTASTPEVCDGIDNDLDGGGDEGFSDTDQDGIADCVDPTPLGICNGLPVMILGTPGNDVIMGTIDNDVIDGLAGDDHISGKGGDDTICGGPGNDVILGDEGNDFLSGGAGKDVCQGGPGNKDTAVHCEKVTEVP